MDRATPRMSNLFLQLGLDESDEAIADFIKTHQLQAGVNIYNAPFWNDGQRQFLSEQLKEDAVWTTVVDQLNEALHAEAVTQEVDHLQDTAGDPASAI